MMKNVFLLFVLGLCLCHASLHTFRFHVDTASVLGPVPPELSLSAGYCPPTDTAGLHQSTAVSYGLAEDMWQNLIMAGSIPNRGDRLFQIRVHFLFDLVRLDAAGGYNWTYLDTFIDRLHQNGLKPGFELMGSPGGTFTNFDDKDQVLAWKDLVTELATRYMGKYGVDYVKQWHFETWNEVRTHDWDEVTFTPTGYLNYYDACAAGLQAAHPDLIFGAPGGSYGNEFVDGLFEHVLHPNSTSYFGGPVYRPDYLAFHAKGGIDDRQIGTANNILLKEYLFVEPIRAAYPELFDPKTTIPWVNDESDPLEGWNRPRVWRSDARYSTLMAQTLALHLNDWTNSKDTSLPTNGMPFVLASFDNAFLNYNVNDSSLNVFDQRTLVARFQMNNTSPQSFQTVKKLSLNIHGIFTLLGDTQVVSKPSTQDPSRVAALSSPSSAGWPAPPTLSDVSTVATTLKGSTAETSTEVAVMVSVGHDSDPANNTLVDIQLYLENLPFTSGSDVMMGVYTVADEASNPYEQWTAAGRPAFPDDALLTGMRSSQELVPSYVKAAPVSSSGTFNVSIDTPFPSVSLVHLCEKPESGPPAVASGYLHTPVSNTNQTFVVWGDVASRCINTYTLEASRDGSTYFRINPDMTFTAFVHDHGAGMKPKSYRVTATDYWGRTSAPLVIE